MLANYLILFVIFILMAAILTHPTVCVAGAASGLLTWFNSVLPSLFPFMVLTGLLIRTGALKQLTERLSRIPLLKRLPLTAFFAVLCGLLCGYPMGIRTVSDLKQTGQISTRQANILYTFVNQPGPMFIIGYAMPRCGSYDRPVLFLVAFYGGILCTALLAILFSFFDKQKMITQHHPDPDMIDQHSSVFILFEDILMSSMATLTKICGYMMIFSLLAALMGELIPQYPLLRLIFSGITEMTSGISLITPDHPLTPYLVLGFISFGGLSVTAQSFTLASLSKNEQIHYLLWKIIQTVLTLTLLVLLEHM